MHKCVTCGQSESRLLEGPGGFEFAECQNCGLLTRTGALSESTRFAAEHRPTSESGDPSVVALRRPIFEHVLRLIHDRVLPGKLLDIGCSTGDFMAMARDKGWTVKGFEPDAGAARIAAGKGLDVSDRPVESSGCEADTFDVVTLLDVVDLAEDPAAVMREALRVLKPGGTAIIRVRNADFHRLAWRLGGPLKSGPLFSFSILHILGFNAANLRRFLEHFGFCGTSVLNSMSPSAAYPGGAIRIVARFWEAIAGVVFYVTGGRRTCSASITAVCRKPNPLPRVMHLITRLDFGGSAENVVLAAKAHAEEGFGILVACGPSKVPTAESSQGAFEIRTVDALVRPIRPISDVAALIAIRKLLKAWQPDILHTHSSKAGILGRWASMGLPIRVIHQPHGHVFYGYFGRIKTGVFILLERITAWLTDDFIALSEGEKRESLEVGIGTPGQWSVINSGVRLNGDSALIQERGRIRAQVGAAANEIVVGTVARLEPVKGVGVFVESIPKIINATSASVRFLIVGDGEEMTKLRERCRILKIESVVAFAGYRTETLPWMSAMDVFVQPSLNEGMGKTLVMAQSLGLPIVATRVCGIPDVVLEGKSGLLVPSNEPARLAEAIIQLIAHPELRKSFGAAGKQWVNSADETGHWRFSDKAMAEHLKNLYLKKTC